MRNNFLLKTKKKKYDGRRKGNNKAIDEEYKIGNF